MDKLDKLDTTSEGITISLPHYIVTIMDDLCERHDFNRSTFVRRALKRYMLSKMDSPEMWKEIYKKIMELSC